MVHSSVIKLKNSISTQLLKIVLTLYIILTIVVGFIHMSADYFSTKDSVIKELSVVQQTFEPGLAKSIWDFNMAQVQSELVGMFRFPSVVGVKFKNRKGKFIKIIGDIINKNGEPVSVDLEGTQLQREGFCKLFWHEFPVMYDDEGTLNNVGQVTIYSSQSIIFQKLKIGFIFLIINSIVKVIAIFILFSWTAKIKLSKPLSILTTAAEQLNIDNLENFNVDVKTSGRNELKILEEAFNQMTDKLLISRNESKQLNIKLQEYNRTLEQKVAGRTQELKTKNIVLNETIEKVEDANKNIMESLRYAEMIQRSLLPGMDVFKTYIPDSFVIWSPRDIVGGDILYAYFEIEKSIVGAVVDCTGHGVPGAFMSMIASSGLRKIISGEGCKDPAEILKKLNFFVKTSLQQDTEQAQSDDGLDISLCYMNIKKRNLTFAGAKLPLIYIYRDKLTVIKGDKQSIGYKRSDLNFNFTNHTISLKKGMSFYMYSDGVTDQLGGERRRMFGSKRFKNLLKDNHKENFDRQRKIITDAFKTHKNNEERQDDVTVIGFNLDKYLQKK